MKKQEVIDVDDVDYITKVLQKKLKTGSLIKFLSKEKMEKFGDKANPHFNFGSSNKTEY